MRITQLVTKNQTITGSSGTSALGSSSTNAAPSAETVLIVSMTKEGSAAVVQFTGLPGQSYILQANESMSSAEWKNVSTNQTTGSGAGSLRNAEAEKHAMRFYRIARP